MSNTINYGELMQKAMRGLMVDILHEIAKKGLPGEHHFFINFDTNHKDVKIADWLRDRYENEMTIVIQNWFDELIVLEDRFSITLNFNDTPENLVVPFDAVKTFVDPSVEFGLRFDEDTDANQEDDIAESPMIIIDEDEQDTVHKDAEIVSLDSFRKQ